MKRIPFDFGLYPCIEMHNPKPGCKVLFNSKVLHDNGFIPHRCYIINLIQELKLGSVIIDFRL